MLQNASSCRFEGQQFTLLHAKTPAASQLYRPLTAGWHSSGRAAAGAALRQSSAYTEAEQNHTYEVKRPTHGESTAVAASGLAALLLFCPGPVFAEELQDITQDAQVRAVIGGLFGLLCARVGEHEFLIPGSHGRLCSAL